MIDTWFLTHSSLAPMVMLSSMVLCCQERLRSWVRSRGLGKEARGWVVVEQWGGNR